MPNDQVEIFKPPIPKARRSIRDTNAIEEISPCKTSNSLSMKSMYKSSPEIYNIPDIQYTDDEDNSHKFLNNSQDSIKLDTFSTAHNSPVVTQVYRRSLNESQSFNNRNSSFLYKTQKQPTKEGFFSKYFRLLLCAVCILFLLFLYIILNTKTETHESPGVLVKEKQIHLTEINNVLDKSIQLIQTQFHNQKSNIWNDISAGIYDVVLFPTKPSIIILFGNETETLNCLAKLLGQLSGKILGSNDYLILTPKDFPNDIGQVIYRLKKPITQKKVIIIQDLLNVNTEALKAFHNFCDREKPLVENAVYIITVVVDGYKPSQRELEFIEKQIFKRLSNYMDKDILDPLITRLTDGTIVPILPESSTNFNYADCSFFYK
ncbi:uncharacterized protein LOC122538064 isoform X3 [Frieseomelitta varia]|uniref:uncharacterized protein LOC122538064 isoform X3 n=1 Tax=Frieseomelitta varia TaxID=561572 RepID=UPI001CB680E6|nr:uncharacterized protein LOC122538064 isoform X3 [Frieseomelitta varia]